jgi:methionyl-tRNA synthetase
MPARGQFYITTAIPYANGAPHIGHAYERIATDAIARFKRLDGFDVLFVTGMDEHGQKMQQTAITLGISPQALADRTTAQFLTLGQYVNSPTDDFIRTTQPRHHAASQAIWTRMAAAGDIYLSKYKGWYSVRDEAYFDADELHDGPDDCKLAPTGSPVEWVEEESYFFRLSNYAKPLLDLYERRPDFVLPEQYRNEIVRFVQRGLSDLSISRTTFNWGIPVPNDPKHVMYVWVDALTNYITATGFPDASANRARYWPANAHVIGKDITRFHAIYWPAFLMSAKLPLPEHIVVHGFLFNRGEKMSKSVGNVIDPVALVNRYGVDQLRYFLLREVPFGQDGNYSHESIIARTNADLANDLGNLAQRSLTMIARSCGAVVPQPGNLSAADAALLEEVGGLLAKARTAIENFALHLILTDLFKVVADTNRYFAAAAPWALQKTDPLRMQTVLYITAEVLRQVAILAQPFMPAAMTQLLDALAVAPDNRDFAHLATPLLPGTPLPGPKPIFPRFVEAPENPARS